MDAPHAEMQPWARFGEPAWTVPRSTRWILPTPDGLHVLAGGLYPFVAVLDAETGVELRRLALAHRHAPCAALHPDGGLLVYAVERQDLVGFDLTSGAQVGRTRTPHPTGIEGLHFFPGGRHLLTRCRERTFFVWNATTGRKAGAGKELPSYLRDLVGLPDGRTVVALHGQGLTIWDRVARRVLGEHRAEGYAGQSGPGALVFAPRHGRLWVALQDAPFVRVFDLLRDHGLREAPGVAPAVADTGAFALAPDGETLLHITQQEVRAFAAATGALRWRRENRELGCAGRERPTGDLRVSADGSRILARTYQDRVLSWDLATGTPHPCDLPHLEGVTALALGRDAARLLVASRGPRVQVWDVPAGRRVWQLGLDEEELSVQGWSHVFREGGGRIAVWFAGREGTGVGLHVDLDSDAPPEPAPSPEPPPGLRSRDGALEVRGGAGGLEVYCTADDERLWNLPGPHGGTYFDARIFPDGRALAVVGRDGGLRIFSLVHGGLLLEHLLGLPGGITGQVWLGDLSEDGELLVCGTKAGEAILLELRRHRVREPGEGVKLVREVRRVVHSQASNHLALSPEGAFLAAASRSHREVRVYRVADLL